MMKYYFAILFLYHALSPAEIFANDSITVQVTVKGFRNENGICRLLLFDSDKGFPELHEYAKLMLSSIIYGKTVEFNFKIQSGKYAISILHDENSDGEMDKTWYGKPTEGFGASNDPKVGIGPPEFEESIVNIDSSNSSLTIMLKYF